MVPTVATSRGSRMGKYMKKAKGAGEVAVMEVSQSSSLGVRTRARTRTLALQKKENKAPSAPPKSSNICSIGHLQTTSYMELRSRRLEKVSLSPCSATQIEQHRSLKNRGLQLQCSDSGRGNLREAEQSAFMVAEEPKSSKSRQSKSAGSVRSGRRVPSTVGYSRTNSTTSLSQARSRVKTDRAEKEEVQDKFVETENIVLQNSSMRQLQAFEDETAIPMEGSFGENVIDQEGRDRGIRECTPSSPIGNGEALEAPGSTTRTCCRRSGRRRMQNEGRRSAPTSREMEEFFAGAEQQQQRLFIERYNYDPVNDLPLAGRYEWVRLRPRN